ncbi:hypothetical protein A2697_00300, partial [Candidatus Curtissbacteria bacterium RIFCSPHIGHO2_01_FULL_41_44]
SFLISKHLGEIFQKENLVPLASPKIAISSLSKNSPFVFTASFTQKPQVTIGDWEKIKVAKIKAKEISEEDINQSIKNIFEAWKARKSDIGGQTSEDDKSGEEAGKFIYDARGNKIFIKDESARPTSEESPSTSLRASKATSEVKDTPDDNFARAIGARDLAHLHVIVKKDLETIMADSAEAKFEQEIFEKILELGSVEVPEILVEDELSRMLLRLASELERQKRKLEDYLAEQKTTIDELKKKWQGQAEKNVRISLILEQIGKDEKVQVAREEVEQVLKGLAQTNLSEEQKKDLEKYIAFNIFQTKTLDLVKKTVTA